MRLEPRPNHISENGGVPSAEYRGIKQELLIYHNYLVLFFSLLKGKHKDDWDELLSLQNNFNRITPKLIRKTDEELRDVYPRLKGDLKEMLAAANSMFPQKMPFWATSFDWVKLSEEYRQKGLDIMKVGVPYGWLNERIDVQLLGFPSDLPYYARIGLGINAGRYNAPEISLLEDGFLMLVYAEDAFDRLKSYRSGEFDMENVYPKIARLKENIDSFCRLSVVSYFAFVESFVNGIGDDFAWRNKERLTAQQLETLSGKKNGRYLALETKMERYPPIIREDGKSPLNLMDTAQRKDPFRALLNEIKETRDSAVHHSETKIAILRSPVDWIKDARMTSKTSVEASREFWSACYPSRPYPQFLGRLDYEILHERIKKRLPNQSEAIQKASSIKED